MNPPQGSAAVPTTSLPWEFKGVVRLTKVGTAYILSTIVLAVAAINTGNNALYIAVSIMLGCLLLSGIASKDGLKRLSVEIEGIDEAWAAQPAHGRLRIANASRIWNVRDVVLVSDALAEPILVPILPRGSSRTIDAPFLFAKRGLARVSAVDSYTRYPFGFFLKKRRLRVSSEVVVFPRLLREEEDLTRFHAVAGMQMQTGRAGAGTEIHSFREYIHGDSFRQVHWKKSASLGRWIIKQHETDAARTVHVVVDPFKPRDVSDEAFEEMIARASTFIHRAHGRGYDVTLSLPRTTLHARQESSSAPLHRALALLEPTYEQLQPLLERGSVLFAAGGTRDAA